MGSIDPSRVEIALRLLGYSAHTGMPRIGDKAQVARWGLGEDELPDAYRELVTACPSCHRYVHRQAA